MFKRNVRLIFTFALFAMMMQQCIYAGQLGKNEFGTYYVKDDGTLAVSEWVEIDDDLDGKVDSFYFNEAGFMAINIITPDGYQVGTDGKYVENKTSNIYTPDKNSESYQQTLNKQAASAKKIRDKRKKNKEKYAVDSSNDNSFISSQPNSNINNNSTIANSVSNQNNLKPQAQQNYNLEKVGQLRQKFNESKLKYTNYTTQFFVDWFAIYEKTNSAEGQRILNGMNTEFKSEQKSLDNFGKDVEKLLNQNIDCESQVNSYAQKIDAYVNKYDSQLTQWAGVYK